MDDKKKAVEFENLNVEPLSDDDLDTVAGGAAAADGDCSNCWWCSDCTDRKEPDDAEVSPVAS